MLHQNKIFNSIKKFKKFMRVTLMYLELVE